jgi:crotonobetainyl-CoA:carnitine CoA-transferase CaiB-like acyl-CoA transferase
MEGVKVVEVAVWVAGPSGGGVLADWGADVIKIEPPDGDPFRGLLAAGGVALTTNPLFEMDNRSKRSVCMDLTTEAGQRAAYDLIDRADVFVSNLRPEVLERLGLDYDTLSRRNPRLVYASVTGYGLSGPDRDRPAYDIGAFWSRSGIAAAFTPPGGTPPFQRGAFGDHMTGMTIAGGISSALYARERTGRGQLVSTSLLRIGIFTTSWDYSLLLGIGLPPTPMLQISGPSTINSYRTSDDKWIWLLGLQGDRHWPDLARAVGHPEWIDDERFRDIPSRTANAVELNGRLNEIFATKTRDEWGKILDREGMWWAPVQTMQEVVEDPQAIASGAFVEVPKPEGGSARAVATPLDFSDTPWQPRSSAPQLGQHTEQVLLELGYDWDQITKMREAGALP